MGSCRLQSRAARVANRASRRSERPAPSGIRDSGGRRHAHSIITVPDPVTTAALIAAGAAVGSRTVDKVLGPSAEQLGEILNERLTEFRARNIGRVIEAAERKGDRDGTVPPRVAHRLLEDGSYCDDELMAEYLGGVLAGSRTPDGRDDRAVTWSALVTSMSALEVRAHFLIYRAIARKVQGTDVNLWDKPGRHAATLVCDAVEFVQTVGSGSGLSSHEVLPNTIPGLYRLGLVDEYSWGSEIAAELSIRPTVPGIQLYGWALGRPGFGHPAEFTALEDTWDESLPDLAAD
jgi:hypothetical protein